MLLGTILPAILVITIHQHSCVLVHADFVTNFQDPEHFIWGTNHIKMDRQIFGYRGIADERFELDLCFVVHMKSHRYFWPRIAD